MKKILVPTDFSAVADNAASYAMHIGEAANKEIVFFHAGNFNEKKMQAHADSLQADSDVLVKYVCVTSTKPFNAETIREIAHDDHIRLIVMGTVGDGALASGKMFGPNTELVIDNAPCPVIAVSPDLHFRWINNIAFATDLSRFDEEIGKVISFAKIFNAQIQIFHLSAAFPDPASVPRILFRERIELAKRLHQYANISYTIDEMPADNAINQGVNRFLETRQIDVLAMFRHNRQPLETLFSSGHTGDTTVHLNVPLLVYPNE